MHLYIYKSGTIVYNYFIKPIKMSLQSEVMSSLTSEQVYQNALNLSKAGKALIAACESYPVVWRRMYTCSETLAEDESPFYTQRSPRNQKYHNFWKALDQAYEIAKTWFWIADRAWITVKTAIFSANMVLATSKTESPTKDILIFAVKYVIEASMNELIIATGKVEAMVGAGTELEDEILGAEWLGSWTKHLFVRVLDTPAGMNLSEGDRAYRQALGKRVDAAAVKKAAAAADAKKESDMAAIVEKRLALIDRMHIEAKAMDDQIPDDYRDLYLHEINGKIRTMKRKAEEIVAAADTCTKKRKLTGSIAQ
jgi:hypothetical protein